jgi:predicted transcriptional regulator
MLSRIAPIVARSAARSTSVAAAPMSVRGFATAGEALTAGDAAKLSGYNNIEFRINESAMVIDAVQQFAAHNIGCLVTVNDAGKFRYRYLATSM